jgi:hypothetical protein
LLSRQGRREEHCETECKSEKPGGKFHKTP